MAFDPITAGLGVGSLLFGMGDRERQKTREHQAAMLQADQTRMSPWLQGPQTASAQASSLMQKQEAPLGAAVAGANSIWAQLQKDKQSEEAAANALKRQEVEDAFRQKEIDILSKRYGG